MTPFGILPGMDTRRARKSLEEERRRLEGELKSIGRPNPSVPGDWELAPNTAEAEPDILDQAEIATSREDNAAVLADLEARYASVTEALARIENKTYGKCEVCGVPIEEARLAADPSALTCTTHR